jgi:hypothetical protein
MKFNSYIYELQALILTRPFWNELTRDNITKIIYSAYDTHRTFTPTNVCSDFIEK